MSKYWSELAKNTEPYTPGEQPQDRDYIKLNTNENPYPPSKSHSLAGLRVGFTLGQDHLIEGLNRVKNSFNSYTLDRLALAGAEAAFKDEAYFQQAKEKIIATRGWVTEELRGLGFEVISSKDNFIFIKPPKLPAADLFRELKEAGISIFVLSTYNTECRENVGKRIFG